MSVVGVLKENYLDTHLSHYLRLSGANESNFKDLIRDELIKLYDEIGPEYKPCTIIHPGTSAPFEDLTVGDYNSIMAKLNSRILFFINKKRYDMLIKDGFADPTEKMFFSSTGVVSNMKLRTYLRFDPNIIKKLYLKEEDFVTHVNTLEKCGLYFQKDYYKREVLTLLDSPGRFTSRGIKTIGDLANLTYDEFISIIDDPQKAQEVLDILKYKPFQFADATIDGEVDDIDYDDELARVGKMIYLLDRIKDIDQNIDYWQATRLNLKSDFMGGITDPLPFDFDNPTDYFIR